MARRPPSSDDDDDDDDDDDSDDDSDATTSDDESPRAPAAADHDDVSEEETDEEGESTDEDGDASGQEDQARGGGGEREEAREEAEVSPELVALALEALDGDDVSPVVRLAFERSAPNAVTHALEVIIERKEAEAQSIVAQSYQEFVDSMAELRHVQEDAEDLSTAVRAHNEQLHTASLPLLDVLRELTATRGVCGRLSSAGQAVDACLGALDLCSRARLALERGQYYASLRLLERVRLQKLPLLAGVPPLRQYFLANLPLAEAAVEDGAKALLDTWLADAAAAAPRIGRAAVAAAAEERTAVDARWDAQLAGVRACSGPGALGQGGKPLFELTLASSQSGGEAEAEADPLQGLTLGPVATARHALAVLAKEDAFWQHYSEARAQQLSALLVAASGAGSATFLEQYQPLLSAVAGFFVTEGHVERASGGGLSHIQVASSWDRASGALAEAIATHLGACTSAAQALLVAHYVRLLTAALRRQGLWTAALDAALADAQDAFHSASHGEALADVRQALKADAALAPLVLHNAGEYARDVVALGLHPRGAEVPSAVDDFPLQAPFTSLVPATLRCLHTAAADSAAFCGARGEEGLRSCCRTTDVLLRTLLDTALMPHLQAAAQRGFDPLLQVAANAAALDAGVDALDGATAEACHMASERATALALAHLAAEGAQAGRPRVLGQFRDAAEEALLAALSSQVESFFVVAPLEEWLPEQPRSLPREAAHATAAFLEHALGQACEVLAPATAARLARAAAGRAADCLVSPITRTGDTGRRFNVHALTGLEADVELLQRMTAHLPVAGLDSCFAEPKQLCTLFSGVSLDALAGPACESPPAFRAALQKDFFALAPSRLALLLDRYREPPAPGLLHRQAAQPPSLFPKRKAAGVVVDRVNTSILKR